MSTKSKTPFLDSLQLYVKKKILKIMPFLIADVMGIGKNIEAVHQKDILGISQQKNKAELWSSREIERSLLYQSIFMR